MERSCRFSLNWPLDQKMLVLWSALVKRFSVTRMRDFFREISNWEQTTLVYCFMTFLHDSVRNKTKFYYTNMKYLPASIICIAPHFHCPLPTIYIINSLMYSSWRLSSSESCAAYTSPRNKYDGNAVWSFC